MASILLLKYSRRQYLASGKDLLNEEITVLAREFAYKKNFFSQKNYYIFAYYQVSTVRIPCPPEFRGAKVEILLQHQIHRLPKVSLIHFNKL